MDATTLQRLTLAWLRRQKWQNKSLAVEVVSLLAEAMGPTDSGSSKAKQSPQKSNGKIPGSEMLAMMGVNL